MKEIILAILNKWTVKEYAFFVALVAGWGTAGLQRGEKVKTEELHQGALKAAQIYAEEAGRLYERISTHKTPFTYHPSDRVKRVLPKPAQ